MKLGFRFIERGRRHICRSALVERVPDRAFCAASRLSRPVDRGGPDLVVKGGVKLSRMNQGQQLHGFSRAEYRFGLVLILLLALFVLLMTGTTSKWARPITVALTGATLLAALIAADVSPRLRRLAVLLALAAFVAALSLVWFGSSTGDGVTGLLGAALVVVAPVAIARSLFRRRVIDVRTVLAALCIYVLIGMLWAFIYIAIGNFASSPFFAQHVTATSADYLYFSFVTYLTVGYGDLTAAGNLGRACAVIEALMGQIYLVTIVALLVSRLVPRRAGESPSDE